MPNYSKNVMLTYHIQDYIMFHQSGQLNIQMYKM